MDIGDSWGYKGYRGISRDIRGYKGIQGDIKGISQYPREQVSK